MTSTSAAAPGPGGLPAFNALPAERARDLLLGCCHAARWAGAVAGGRPYASAGALLARAAAELTAGDVTEALAGHPRIGEGLAAGHRARGEQSGVRGASEAVRAGLAAGNQAYERRFGHIYLVCATGRSGAELLAILHDRLRNEPDAERAVVRGELIKINDLRLAALIGAAPTGPGAP